MRATMTAAIKHIADPGGPGKQSRQHIKGIERQEDEADYTPMLHHRQGSQFLGEDEVPEALRKTVSRQKERDGYGHCDPDG